jgi:nudix-type nucleoside diphosphatase (YffH/AdpP family)
MRKVDLISRRLAFDDLFKVEEAQLRFARYDGSMSPVVRRLNFLRGDSAAALLIDAGRSCVYLTEQFKYPTLEKGGGWIVEVVAGTVEPDELPEQTIKREIREEVGFEVANVVPIADFFVSPGGSSERIFLFYALVTPSDRKSAGGGFAGEHEDIQVVEWPIDGFLSKLRSGALHDAKTIVAACWLEENHARLAPV